MQGTLVATFFMQLWGDAWCRKHIHHFVAISGPWGGSVNALKASVSGDNFNLYFPHDLLHTVQGTSPSGPWLFPSQDVWHRDDVLVRTRRKNYTAAHFEDLLQVRWAAIASERHADIQSQHSAAELAHRLSC